MFRNNFVPVKIVAIFVMFYEPYVNLLLLFRKVSCRGYQRKKKKKVSCRCLSLLATGKYGADRHFIPTCKILR